MKREFTKLGQVFYNWTIKAGKFFIKNKFLYYFLIFTWGLPYSLLGLLASLFLLITGHKPRNHYLTWYFYCLKGWGGVSLGSNFVVGHDCDSCRDHEMGHTVQVAIFGPLFIFLVAIPSFIRYWVMTIKGNYSGYDDIWFEASATDVGNLIVNLVLNEKSLNNKK